MIGKALGLIDFCIGARREKAARHDVGGCQSETLNAQKGVRIVEMVDARIRLIQKELRRVDEYCSVGLQLQPTAIHWTWRRAGEVDSVNVVFAAVAWAVENILLR